MVRCTVAHAGNDHRLGAQEAPPAIISLYPGQGFEAFVESICAGGDLLGYMADMADDFFLTFPRNTLLGQGMWGIFLRFSKSKDIKLKRRSRRLPWYCSRLHFFKLIWGRNQIWKLMKQPSGKAGKVDWLLLVFWSPHTSLVMTSLCKQYLDLCGERRVMRKHRDQLNLSLAGDWLQCGHAHRGQRRGPQPHRALPLLRQPLRVSRGGFLAELLPAHHGLQRRHVRRHGAPCRTDRRVLGSKKNHWHWFSRCSRCSMSIY